MQGSEYTDDQRRQAVVAYQVWGNARKIERELGIPNTTIQDWKQTEWWHQLTLETAQAIKEETVADIGRTYAKYVAALEDRVDNGDSIPVKQLVTVTGPDGGREFHTETVIKRIPVKARDLAVSSSILFGQRQMLLNQPTSITAGAGLADMATQLVQAFQAIVAANKTPTAERVTDLIEAQP